MTFRVVNTDNFDGDYPNEEFVGPVYETEKDAEVLADSLNSRAGGEYATQYYKIVPESYKLQPGFEP